MADRVSAAQSPRVDHPTVVGIAVTAIPVAVFSSVSLFTTAREAGVPVSLSWVLPVATDLAALVATRVWLSPNYGRAIRRYAAAIALTSMALSFVGASLHLVFIQAAPVWLRLGVGGLPSLSLAAVVHLGAMIIAERATLKSSPTDPLTPPVEDAPSADAPVETASPEEDATSGPAGASARTRSTASARTDGDNVVTPIGATSSAKKRQRMYAHLDAHPNTSGVELDRLFDTRNYGRVVRRDWLRLTARQASGE